MKIGITEFIVICIVALFVIGPDRLPEYAKKFGQSLAMFRRYSNEVTKDIKESIAEPLNEAKKPIDELKQEVKSNAGEVQKSFAELEKPEYSDRIMEEQV